MELRTVRIGLGRLEPTNAVVSLAVERGHLFDAGIDLRRSEFGRGRAAEAVMAAMSGEVDVVICPGVAILQAAMAGGDPLNVMSLECDNVLAVIGAQGIRSTGSLYGSVVGVTGSYDQHAIVLRRALREFGLDPDIDVTFREYGKHGAVWAALVVGEVSAMCASVPQPLLARKIGLPILRDYRDTPEPYQCSAIVTTRRFAHTQGQLLRDLLAAIGRGTSAFRDDPDAALRHLMARGKITDDDVLRETHRHLAAALKQSRPTQPPLQAVARDLEAALGAPLHLDLPALVDPGYVSPRPDDDA